MIILDSVSWHPRCALEVEITELNRLLSHVGKRVNPNLSQVIIYKRYEIIKLFLLRLENMDRKSSDEHMFTPLTGKTRTKPEKKFMYISDKTQQKSEN